MNAKGVCFWPRSCMARAWRIIGRWWVFFRLSSAAIVWIRGLSFFNLRFLERMVLCGLVGLLFYLLLPLLAVISGKVPVTFWEALKVNLVPQYDVLKFYFFCCLHPSAIS